MQTADSRCSGLVPKVESIQYEHNTHDIAITLSDTTVTNDFAVPRETLFKFEHEDVDYSSIKERERQSSTGFEKKEFLVSRLDVTKFEVPKNPPNHNHTRYPSVAAFRI